MCGNLGISALVHGGLPLLGVPRAIGLGGLGDVLVVLMDAGTCTILADGDGAALAQLPLDGPAHGARVGPVPAGIGVIGHDVGHVVLATAVLVGRRHSQARGVLAVRQVVEHRHQLVGAVGPAQLVEQAPAEDALVVEVLADELDELLHGGGIEGRGACATADVGYLGPHHHARAVTQGVEVVGMRIVGQTDAVGSNLADEGHVLVVLASADGPPHALAVLVTVDPTQGVAASVEREAPVGVDTEVAQPHVDAQRVDHTTAVQQLEHKMVALRVVNAIPQHGTADDKRLADLPEPVAHGRSTLRLHHHWPALRVDDRCAQTQLGTHRMLRIDPCPDGETRPLVGHLVLADVDTRAGIVEWCEASGG